VLVYQRRQSGNIFLLHGKSLGAELLDNRIDVERVPEDDDTTECK
jgi:hypothetical protein